MTLHWTAEDGDSAPSTGSILEALWQTLRARGGSSSTSGAPDSQQDLADYCASPMYDWADNSDGLNPCQLARVHADVCAESSSYYPLGPLQLDGGQRHYPLLSRIQASACTCSVPVYNLIQVCAACQQPLPSGPTTPFYDFTANCSWRSLSFPYSSPSPLPAWARIDPFGGSINVSVAFHQVNGNGNISSTSGIFNSPSPYPLPPSSTASPPQTATTPSSSSPVMSDGHLGHNPAPKEGLNMGAVIGAVVVAVVALGAVAGIVTWLRRKRRTRRQGTRLGSTTDLVGSDEHKGSDGGLGGGMREKAPGRDDMSLFVPTESFMSSRPSRSDSRTYSRTDSFTTNSSSSQSHDYRAFLVGEGASSTRFGTSYTGTDSSGTETETASQSFDSRSRSTGRDSLSVNLDDDAASPFADVHRAPSSRSASSRLTMSDTGSYPAAAVLRAKYAPAAHQRLSVATMASLTPSAVSVDAPSTASSRAAPSSTGAVYGRDDDASSFDSQRD